MVLDRRQRVQLKRVNNNIRRHSVAAARRLIYEKNYAVDSKAVDDILKAESLTPTVVG